MGTDGDALERVVAARHRQVGSGISQLNAGVAKGTLMRRGKTVDRCAIVVSRNPSNLREIFLSLDAMQIGVRPVATIAEAAKLIVEGRDAWSLVVCDVLGLGKVNQARQRVELLKRVGSTLPVIFVLPQSGSAENWAMIRRERDAVLERPLAGTQCDAVLAAALK